MGSSVAVFLTQLSLVVTVLVTQTQAATWGHEIPYEKMAKEKMTRLHFYFHDTMSGKTPTAIKVAEAPTTKQSSSSFGAVFMVDDPLTEGPEPTSKLLGRAQGLYGFAGQKEPIILMALSYFFTDDKYNGSSLSVLTRNPITNPVREFSVVGGTGLFRFARGFIHAKTYWVNFTSADAIVEYNVTVLHY